MSTCWMLCVSLTSTCRTCIHSNVLRFVFSLLSISLCSRSTSVSGEVWSSCHECSQSLMIYHYSSATRSPTFTISSPSSSGCFFGNQKVVTISVISHDCLLVPNLSCFRRQLIQLLLSLNCFLHLCLRRCLLSFIVRAGRRTSGALLSLSLSLSLSLALSLSLSVNIMKGLSSLLSVACCCTL